MSYRVLKERSQDWNGASHSLCIVHCQAPADVSCRSHRHTLYTSLEEVQEGQDSQQATMSEAGLWMLM